MKIALLKCRLYFIQFYLYLFVVELDLPVKLTSSRRFILTSVRRSKLTTYFQY